MQKAAKTELYQRLLRFELDDPTHEFGFTRHLMKNHGWTETYARRAIAEYKKFAFLTVAANHQVVPSDQVDQVWHAHVLLTQSYWEEFCPKILGKKLHHHPARGGKAEREEFHTLYRQTITSYQQFFGTPPTDIWSPPDIRFGKELKMQRVSLSDYWLIPKRFPQLSFSQLIAMLIVGLVIISWIGPVHASVSGQISGQMQSTFSAHAIGTLGTIIFGLLLRYFICQPIHHRSQKPQLSVYETAYLAGNNSRAVELAIARLVQQGYLRPNLGNRTLRIAKPLTPQATALEKQVMQQAQHTPDFQSLRQVDKYSTSFLSERLEQERLVMTGGAAFLGESFALFVGVSFLGGFLIGITGVDFSQMKLLNLLYQATGIITLCCFTPSQRTGLGGRILSDIKNNHDAHDVIQRFALYGYKTLSGGELDNLRKMFEKEKEDATGGCGCGC